MIRQKHVNPVGFFSKPERLTVPKEIILRALSQSDFVSGEVLAKQLGMTRPAVWKYITQLKEEGFRIESLQG